MRNFRKYDLWLDSIDFCQEVYFLTEKFPTPERYGLISQLRRASVSIPSNIAEGCSRHSQREFRRFVEIALGSAFEIETQLIIAQKRMFFSKSELEEFLSKLESLQRRLNALRTKLSEKV